MEALPVEAPAVEVSPVAATPAPAPVGRRRRWPWAVTAVVVAAGAAATTFALTRPGGDWPGAEELLGRARDRLGRAEAITGTIAGDDGSVREFTYQSDGSARVVYRKDGLRADVVTVDGVAYARWLRQVDGRERPSPWWALPFDDNGLPDPRSQVVGAPLDAGLAGVVRLVESAGQPVDLGARDGARTLKVRFDLLGGLDGFVSVRRDGTLVGWEYTFPTGEQRVAAGVREVEAGPIAPPPAGLVADEVVDIAGLLAVEAYEIVVPQVIFRGWSVVAAVVLPAPLTAEGCDQVSMLFLPVTEEAVVSGELLVYELPPGCTSRRPAGAVDFGGGIDGFYVEGTDGTLGTVMVDGHAVQFETDLPIAAVAPVVTAWVPWDLDAAVGAAADAAS